MERARKDELLTIKEAAEFLKISTMTLSRWIKQGRLTRYRVGARSVRLRRSDVEALLTSDATTEWPEARDDLAFPPLTPEEVARQEAAIEQANAVRERLREAHGGRTFPSSAGLIARERRERRIAG